MAETNREGRTAYAAARHLIVDIETLGLTVPAPVLSRRGIFGLFCGASGFDADVASEGRSQKVHR